MVSVLFVCLGNICRSPMAEAVFAHQVREAGLDNVIKTDSAGTGSWHVGEQPHRGTRAILARNGVACEHRARQISTADLDRFDYVLTMDDENLRTVRGLGDGTAVVRPFLSYAPNCALSEVPDPYYTGGFQEVYDLVTSASAGLLAAVRKEQGL
ncbi:MAG: low molecular weight protein-tyrosine-phosphatase [Capsulimonadaceae bacterium]